jgi:hypothetical protein
MKGYSQDEDGFESQQWSQNYPWMSIFQNRFHDVPYFWHSKFNVFNLFSMVHYIYI